MRKNFITVCPKCGSRDIDGQGRCKPCRRKARKVWYQANAHNERARISEYRDNNRERIRESDRAYKLRNPEKLRAHENNRRAREKAATGHVSRSIVPRLNALQHGKCACGCGQPLGDDYHLDHRMPLALGGTNTDDNMQLLRKQCNLKKGALHPVDFMQSQGFLI